MGNPKVISVMAPVRQISQEPPPAGITQDVEDHVVIMIYCEGGKVGMVESAWVANIEDADGLFVFGTKAGLKFDPLTKITAQRVDVPPSQRRGVLGDDLYVPVTEKVLPFERPTLPGQGGNVTGAFVEAVAEGRQPMTPAATPWR